MDFTEKYVMKNLVALLFVVSVCASAASNKIAQDIDTQGSGSVDVIVQFNQPPGTLTDGKVKKHAGTLKKHIDLVNGSLYTIPAGSIAALANDPDVKYISPDRKVKGSLEFAEPTVNANIARQYGIPVQGSASPSSTAGSAIPTI